MNRYLLPFLTLGCATHIRTGVEFSVSVMDTTPCVWVVRTETVLAYSVIGSDRQGQAYLYYCCPSEDGADPLCLNPRWSNPSNDRRPHPSLDDLETLGFEIEK